MTGKIELDIIEFKEGEFFFNKNVEYSEEVRKNISVELRPELIYKHGSDVAFIRLASVYKNGGTVVMRYDMSLGFIIKDWSKGIAQMSEQDIRSLGALSEMTNILIGFFRGALAVHAKGSELGNTFFPFLKTDEFVSNIHLRLAEGQKKED